MNASRLGDKAQNPIDAHGCPACPHPVVGPVIEGSPDVKVNKRPAVRCDDKGIHAACCGTNTWKTFYGSDTVFINGRRAIRKDDITRHCGGMGKMVEGSPNVFFGGAKTPCSSQPPPPPRPDDQHWVYVTITSKDGLPVPNLRWQLTLPDGSTQRGVTDRTGAVSVKGVRQPGECHLVLPDIDDGGADT